MYGAILGDMVGVPYEFEGIKQPKDFTMLSPCFCSRLEKRMQKTMAMTMKMPGV